MKFNENLLEHLTPKQRLCLAFEAQARGDEAEYLRLADTCPRKTYSGPDLMFRGSFDAITGLSLATECDLRGHALSWLIALRSGEPETAREILAKMKILNQALVDILLDSGLSDEAIQAARPETHFVVENLLAMAGDGEPPDPAMVSIFDQLREQIPVLKKTRCKNENF